MRENLFCQLVSHLVCIGIFPRIKLQYKGIDMPVFLNPSHYPCQFFIRVLHHAGLIRQLVLCIIFNDHHFLYTFLHTGPEGMLLEVKPFDESKLFVCRNLQGIIAPKVQKVFAHFFVAILEAVDPTLECVFTNHLGYRTKMRNGIGSKSAVQTQGLCQRIVAYHPGTVIRKPAGVQGNKGMNDMEGLGWCVTNLEAVQVVYGKFSSAVIKHTKSPLYAIVGEQHSNFIINGHVVDAAGGKKKV